MKKSESLKLHYYELILTEDCNMRCTYCFDDNYSDRVSCNYDPVMKIEMIDNLFNFIQETYDKESEKIIVNLFGGEPLMNFEFIKEFINRSKLELKEIPFKWTTNTNILSMNKEVMDFILENKIGVNISLDGRQESHDVNRFTVNKKPTWELMMKILPEFLVKCQRNGTHCGFLMVVNEKNYTELVENYKFITSLSPHVNILFDTNKDFEEGFLESIEESLETLFVKNRNILPTDFSRKYLNKDYIENVNGSCFVPDKNVSINPDGKIFYCHQVVPKMYDIKEDFTEYYGDIENGYINQEYYNTMKERTNFKEFSKNNECKDCPVDWCKGGCFGTHRFYSESINGLNPNLCKLNLVINNVIKKL